MSSPYRWINEEQKPINNGGNNPAVKKQVGGNHYQLPIQPIDYILLNKLGYCEGNVIKYVTRYKQKNGKEDLLKAIHYLQFLLSSEYNTKTEFKEL